MTGYTEIASIIFNKCVGLCWVME